MILVSVIGVVLLMAACCCIDWLRPLCSDDVPVKW
jgi:hypothetical protein